MELSNRMIYAVPGLVVLRRGGSKRQERVGREGRSGIGKACAERLAHAGAHAGAAVTVLDLNGDTAKQVAGEIRGESLRVDLSDHDVLDSLEIEADIVVNNAGLRHVAIEEFPPSRIVRKTLPGMYESG